MLILQALVELQSAFVEQTFATQLFAVQIARSNIVLWQSESLLHLHAPSTHLELVVCVQSL